MKLKLSGIVFIIILLALEVYVIMTEWIVPLSWGTVPLTRLPASWTYITLWMVWPLIGGIIMVIIMPRILGPLFLKIKGVVWRDYKNAYVDLPHPKLTQKRILRRALYLSLLTMGVVSLLIYIIPYELLLPPGPEVSTANEFHMASVASLAGLVVPLSVALWSASWSFREASLVHYKIPDDGTDELYEVEPIHMRYDSFLKGYAGFSSLLFLINLTVFYLATRELVLAGLVLYVFMHISLLTLPAVYLHSRMNHMWLRKNLPKAKRFTKSSVQILEE